MEWLKITRLCKEFNCLPWQGGLFQQPHRVLVRLEAVMDASARWEELEIKRQKAGYKE